MTPIRPWVLGAAAVLLFVIWSNSFIAMSYLLGGDGAPARFNWIGLTVARFLPAAGLCAVYCIGFRRRESWRIVRAYPARLLLCGSLIVPGYNLALNWGQQHGVPAPVASLTTALVPLFVMLLAALFLGEALTRPRLIGFAVAALGMALVSVAKRGDGPAAYPVLIAVTALAPAAWSVYSVVSKPLAGRVSPLLWTYLATAVGGLLVLPLLPGRTWEQWSALDAPGWGALLYLTIPCTVLGFAVWTWLLRHLPAASVGFTVFLNPPLTTVSKYLLALALPATFAFTIRPLEWVGGVLALLGLAVAVRPAGRPPRAGRRQTAAPPEPRADPAR